MLRVPHVLSTGCSAFERRTNASLAQDRVASLAHIYVEADFGCSVLHRLCLQLKRSNLFLRRPQLSRLRSQSLCTMSASSCKTADAGPTNAAHPSPSGPSSIGQVTRLAVVGDVHGDWCAKTDAAALKALQPDMTIFVGDFGEERTDIVSQIMQLDMPKAVLLGNHDAWYVMKGKVNPKQQLSPQQSPAVKQMHQPAASNGVAHASPTSQATSTGQQHASDNIASRPSTSCLSHDNGVDVQLRLLGTTHVGYTSQCVPGHGVSIVGGRPFSKGGSRWGSVSWLLQKYYGVGSMLESGERIVQAVKAAPPHDVVVLVAHNGPTGMGKRPCDPCGVDWGGRKGGDHGDPDLRDALDHLAKEGRPVAAVIFGHMHHKLQVRGLRRMVHVDVGSGTVCLNAATVPRIRKCVARPGSGSSPSASTPAALHHFLLVTIDDGLVTEATDMWVEVRQAAATDDSNSSHELVAHVAEQQRVLRTVAGEKGVVRMLFNAADSRWEQMVMSDVSSRSWLERRQKRQAEHGDRSSSATGTNRCLPTETAMDHSS